MLIAAILHNTELNRYHPIMFVRASQAGTNSADTKQVFKSADHHTVGFLSLADARAHVAAQCLLRDIDIRDSKTLLQWDGRSQPRFTELLAIPARPAAARTIGFVDVRSDLSL